MKFEIKNRFSGEVQFKADIDCGDDAPLSVKVGLAVKWALKARTDLAGADLAGADLADANLAGANLAGANLADALKIDPADIPVIPNIDAAILAEIERGGTLDMGSWHGPNDHWCGTTHCRAGWAVHIAGAKGKALQDRVGPQMAGTLIYHASRPGAPSPHFFASTDEALADIRKCAAKQTASTGSAS